MGLGVSWTEKAINCTMIRDLPQVKRESPDLSGWLSQHRRIAPFAISFFAILDAASHLRRVFQWRKCDRIFHLRQVVWSIFIVAVGFLIGTLYPQGFYSLGYAPRFPSNLRLNSPARLPAGLTICGDLHLVAGGRGYSVADSLTVEGICQVTDVKGLFVSPGCSFKKGLRILGSEGLLDLTGVPPKTRVVIENSKNSLTITNACELDIQITSCKHQVLIQSLENSSLTITQSGDVIIASCLTLKALSVSDCPLLSLSKNLTVTGDLNVSRVKACSFSDDLTLITLIGDAQFFECPNLSMPKKMKLYRNLRFIQCDNFNFPESILQSVVDDGMSRPRAITLTRCTLTEEGGGAWEKCSKNPPAHLHFEKTQ